MGNGMSRLARGSDLIRDLGFANAVRLAIQKLQGRDLYSVRLPAARAPVHFRRGTIDRLVLEKIFMRRDCDPRLPVEPSLIVDAGANVGYWSVRMANDHPDADIIAVEPDRSNFELMQRNFQPYPRIRAVHGAVWHERRPVRISNPESSHEAFRVEAATAAEAGDSHVQGYAIPDLLELAGRKRVDLLKLDIEGAEKAMFQNDPDSWLVRVDILVIEVHEDAAPGCTDVVLGVLNERGPLLERLGPKGYVFDLRSSPQERTA